MSSFLGNVGFLAIAFIVICGYGKMLDYYDLKRSKLIASDKVYTAADKFAKGASAEEVKMILESCVDIDKEEVEKIIGQVLVHKKDKDGGYQAFIKSVNKVIGENR